MGGFLMRTSFFVALALGLGLAGSASADVAGTDFDALEARVRRLEAEVQLLREEVRRLREPKEPKKGSVTKEKSHDTPAWIYKRVTIKPGGRVSIQTACKRIAEQVGVDLTFNGPKWGDAPLRRWSTVFFVDEPAHIALDRLLKGTGYQARPTHKALVLEYAPGQTAESVEGLRQTLGTSSSTARPSVTPRASPQPTRTARKAAWLGLRKGMSMQQVISIIGHPIARDHASFETLPPLDSWRYPNGGWVLFDGGKLDSWTTPWE